MSPARASAAAAAAARRASAATASCRRPASSMASVDGGPARRAVFPQPRGPAPPRGARDAAMRELMAARDDKRADKLDAAAGIGEGEKGEGRERGWRDGERAKTAPTHRPNTPSPPTPATSYDCTPPLTIIRYPDPRLRAPNARVGFFDEKLALIARAMFDAMYSCDDEGVGLAAPQVGVNLRLMVFNPEGDAAKPEEEVVLVNPRVISSGGPLRPFEEGCLSFPGIYGEVVVSLREREREKEVDEVQRNARALFFLSPFHPPPHTLSAPPASKSKPSAWMAPPSPPPWTAGPPASSSTSTTTCRACCLWTEWTPACGKTAPTNG